MRITVEYFMKFRELTGVKSEVVECDTSMKVWRLLECISEKYGENLRNALFDKGGNVREGITILINGRNIRGLNEYSTVINGDCVVSIFPLAAGGDSISTIFKRPLRRRRSLKFLRLAF